MKRLSILYVDGDQKDREEVEQVLGEYFDITTTDSVMKAIGMIELDDYDAVLSELRMPRASGSVIMKYCQESNIPCAIVTAQRWLRNLDGVKCDILDRCSLQAVPDWVRQNVETA